MREMLKAPFAYFGGKSSVADLVWDALGDPKHYIEPFCGSAAVLLARPNWNPKEDIETINDADGHVCNCWRALQAAPDEVAKWCDWPVNHCDLSARRKRLVEHGGKLKDTLIADDSYFDAKLAGYWIWCASCWIGSGMTSPNQIPHVSDGGQGVHALGQIPHVSDGGHGVQEPYNTNIYEWFRRLSERLRYVRVVCGDWTRLCGGNWQDIMGTAGVYFDPPYDMHLRDDGIYDHDSVGLSERVRAWCLERGTRPSYRIVLSGYEGEHNELERHGWRVKCWKAQGGYGNLGDENSRGKKNRHQERLWLSPGCLFSELF